MSSQFKPIEWNWIADKALVAFCISAGAGVMAWVCFAIGVLPDYSTFWTAAGLSLTDQASEVLYDARRMTELQSWLVRNEQFRPWAYPPSSLLVLLPFAQIPFWSSLVIWSSIGAALYFAAAWLFSRSIAAAALASLSFATVLVAVHGHLTNLVAALVFAGLATLGATPVLAGILLGAAATIKPQLLILAPIALLAGRHYSALMASIATGSLIGIASVMVFGIDLWLAWLRSLPTFLDIVRHNEIADFGVTPVSMASQLGLDGTAALALRLVLGLVGIVVCWRVFRMTAGEAGVATDPLRCSRLADRLAAMIGGGFLVLPYAMGYELAVLAPAAAMHVLGNKRSPLDWFLAAIAALVLVSWWSASVWVAAAFTLGVCGKAISTDERPTPDDERIRA